MTVDALVLLFVAMLMGVCFLKLLAVVTHLLWFARNWAEVADQFEQDPGKVEELRRRAWVLPFGLTDWRLRVPVQPGSGRWKRTLHHSKRWFGQHVFRIPRLIIYTLITTVLAACLSDLQLIRFDPLLISCLGVSNLAIYAALIGSSGESIATHVTLGSYAQRFYGLQRNRGPRLRDRYPEVWMFSLQLRATILIATSSYFLVAARGAFDPAGIASVLLHELSTLLSAVRQSVAVLAGGDGVGSVDRSVAFVDAITQVQSAMLLVFVLTFVVSSIRDPLKNPGEPRPTHVEQKFSESRRDTHIVLTPNRPSRRRSFRSLIGAAIILILGYTIGKLGRRR